ncbi:hypothetical protein BASA81_002609 [Batrachochytrium salamandrivorans]|nr:hypothetical protein BASA81_002609 [Batrachochytrium salamandrivorans]
MEAEPAVESLTRGVMKLLDRFSKPEEPVSSPFPASPSTYKKPSSSSSYQEFILNLKALAEDNPQVLRSIGEFIDLINQKPLPDPFPHGEDDQQHIPGAYEAFAAEIKQFCLAKSGELIALSPIWKSRHEVLENLSRVVFTKVYAKTFAPSSEHRLRDEQLRNKIARLSGVINPVANLDLKPSLLPGSAEEGESQLWQKAESCLVKLNSSKAPHEKLQSIQNASLVLHLLIKSKREQPIPDVFIPCLVLLLIRANPPHLFSNVEFIAAHQLPALSTQDSPTSEHFVHFASAVEFLRTSNAKSLSMTEEEFAKVVEPQVGLESTAPQQQRLMMPDLEWIQQRAVFEHATVDDLKVSDVSKLLNEYKLLLQAMQRATS